VLVLDMQQTALLSRDKLVAEIRRAYETEDAGLAMKELLYRHGCHTHHAHAHVHAHAHARGSSSPSGTNPGEMVLGTMATKLQPALDKQPISITDITSGLDTLLDSLGQPPQTAASTDTSKTKTAVQCHDDPPTHEGGDIDTPGGGHTHTYTHTHTHTERRVVDGAHRLADLFSNWQAVRLALASPPMPLSNSSPAAAHTDTPPAAADNAGQVGENEDAPLVSLSLSPLEKARSSEPISMASLDTELRLQEAIVLEQDSGDDKDDNDDGDGDVGDMYLYEDDVEDGQLVLQESEQVHEEPSSIRHSDSFQSIRKLSRSYDHDDGDSCGDDDDDDNASGSGSADRPVVSYLLAKATVSD
jgi:hypothetical protein